MFRINFNKRRKVKSLNQLLSAYSVEADILDDVELEKWASDEDMSVEDLKKVYPTMTVKNRYETDLYFGRTDEDTMKGLASFVKKHPQLIKSIEGAEMLIERGEIDESYHEALRSLELHEEEPKKLPIEEQTDDELQGGVLLCKSWGVSYFWVVFGNVETPRFMKKRIYEDDRYNNLYKTKNGHAVLLMPLLDLGKANHLDEIFKGAWDTSLREHPAYFNTLVYNTEYMHVDVIVNDLAEFYTLDELNARLEDVRQRIIGMNYHRGEGEIIESNGKRYVYGTNLNHPYQSSKEKRAWDFIVNAIRVKTKKG